MYVRQLPPLQEQQLPQGSQLPPQISEMLTSCWIPKCGTMRDLATEDRPPTGRERWGPAIEPEAKQALVLRNIEIEVRKHVTTAMNQSIDETSLWSELDLQKSGDESSNYTWDSGSYSDDDTYTQGDYTHADSITVNENKKPDAEESYPDEIPVVTSVRDRFHYMRAQNKFSNPLADDPPSDKSVTTMKSMHAEEAMKNVGRRPNLAPLRTSAFPNIQLKGNLPPRTPDSGAIPIMSAKEKLKFAKDKLKRQNELAKQIIMSAKDKLKRQNELAKQIMRRRANAASNRAALEP
jgi:hypothetical protein